MIGRETMIGRWTFNRTVEAEALGIGDLEQLLNELQTEPPVAVDGVRSVWCSSALADDRLLLINIVATCDDAPDRDRAPPGRVG